MKFQELFGELAKRVGEQPLVSATVFGVIFACVYLVLMLMTRLGDFRRGLQSFALSMIIHLLLLLVLGEFVPQTLPSATPSDRIGDTLIAEVTLEEPIDLSSLEQSESPPREMMLEMPREDFERREAPQSSEVAIPEPERESVVVDSQSLEIPNQGRTDSPEVIPETAQTEIEVGGGPASKQLEIDEETAKAASQTQGSTPQRQQATSRESGKETMKARESTAESRPIPQIKESGNPNGVETISPQRLPEAEEGLVDNAAEQKGDLAAEDPGPTGAPREETPPVGTFTRTNPRRESPSKPSSTEKGSSEKQDGNGSSQSARLSRGPTRDSQFPAMKLDPLSGTPGGDGTGIPSQIPSTYRLRHPTERREGAISRGASAESEQAVERALGWLAMHQDPAGYWDADGFSARCPVNDRCEGEGGDQRKPSGELEARSNAFDPEALKNAGKFADTGVTGLVVLCFLGAGYTHEEGKYADEVDRALRWLVSQQREDGFIGGQALRYDKMYCHGMATLALGEACGMTRDPSNSKHLRPALVKGVQYIIDVQNPKDGGWRYLPGQRSDMSMFGWQLMALRSAEVAGITIPAEARTRMRQFLQRSATGSEGGLSAYMPGESPKRSMTAESLYCRQILGERPNQQAIEQGVAYLLDELPRQSRPDLYYWYYGTLALYHHGGEPWEKWNGALQSTLVRSQRKSGHAAGSWDPRDPWSIYGGRLYATTFSVLSLEIYYRFLPMYQANSQETFQQRQ